MKHEELDMIGSLRQTATDDLEAAVDRLLVEAGASIYGDYLEAQAARAEALAIIGHELRRRAIPQSTSVDAT